MISKSKKLYEAISSTENYWDATELTRAGFMSLMKFNFGNDAKGNNYIITNDAYEVKRFRASSDEDAINFFNEYKDIEKNQFGDYSAEELEEIKKRNNITFGYED